MTEVVLALAGDEQARITETDGDVVVLSCSRAFPPGSTLEGSSELGALRVKVRSCKKLDAEFRIDGRFVSLSREQRERLVGA